MPTQYSAHICDLIIVLFALTGIISCCGGHPFGGTSTSTRAAYVTINSNILRFGTVTVGSSKSSAVMLTNTSPGGAPDLTVNDIAATGSGYVLKSPTTPITLVAGQHLSITVTFTPISSGRSDGRLSVSIQGSSAPALVELSGTGLSGGPDGGHYGPARR